MLEHDLTLPQRSPKPRTAGLTMIIDNGLPNGEFTDVLECNADLVDYVKYGDKGLDEMIITVDKNGKAIGVEMPALRTKFSKRVK